MTTRICKKQVALNQRGGNHPGLLDDEVEGHADHVEGCGPRGHPAVGFRELVSHHRVGGGQGLLSSAAHSEGAQALLPMLHVRLALLNF